MKKTLKEYLTEMAVLEVFQYARQRQCVHDQRLYVGFKTNDMRQVYIQPDISVECQFIADVTARYQDRIVTDVEVHRIITKEQLQDEEKAARNARRAAVAAPAQAPAPGAEAPKQNGLRQAV